MLCEHLEVSNSCGCMTQGAGAPLEWVAGAAAKISSPTACKELSINQLVDNIHALRDLGADACNIQVLLKELLQRLPTILKSTSPNVLAGIMQVSTYCPLAVLSLLGLFSCLTLHSLASKHRLLVVPVLFCSSFHLWVQLACMLAVIRTTSLH